MFKKKNKPVSLPGSDAELVKQFRFQFTRMQTYASAVRDRGITIKLSTGCGENRSYAEHYPEELRVEEIKRTTLETF